MALLKKRHWLKIRQKQHQALRLVAEFTAIGIGIFCAGLGLKGFLIPNGFIDGGITGISLLGSQVTHIPVGVFIILLNSPFVILSIRQISWTFALKTLMGIVGLSLCLWLVQFPVITTDKLLIAVFGGLLLGSGIGLCIRGGGVIDGTEVLALYIHKKTSLTIGDIILAINILIFSIAATVLSLEQALYSILTYLAASKTVDFIVQGIEEYIGLTIISLKSHTIREMLIHDLERGITVYKGQSGYGKKGFNSKELDIIFTVITRLEISKIKAEIDKIDPAAFIIEHSINDTKGGMIKKRAFKH